MNEIESPRRSFKRRGWLLFGCGFLAGCATMSWVRPLQVSTSHLRPNAITSWDNSAADDPSAAGSVSMQEVLQLANDALKTWQTEVDDYTATLVKQESISGTVGEPNEMFIKSQCRHRSSDRQETEPMRVYLRFDQPPSVAGREVIWCEDLHDGKLVAHEGGFKGLFTLRLDPNGMLAMLGQKYPISEIGITNLIKQLIQRGEQDLDNPQVSVTIRKGLRGDAQQGTPESIDLIEVRRDQPTGSDDDFAIARIYFDNQRKIPFRYEAYGWPTNHATAEPLSAPLDVSKLPLLESYAYLHLQTNVGLTAEDFDPANPSYQYR